MRRPRCRRRRRRTPDGSAASAFHGFTVPAIDSYLNEILDKKGSDLHFIAGDPARVRQYGELMSLRQERLDANFVKEALYEIMPKTAQDRFEEKDGADFAYTLGDRGQIGRVHV